MSVLKIKIFDNEAELCSFSTEDSDKLIFLFDGTEDGYLKIGSSRVPIKSSQATLKLSALNDGLLFPKLIFPNQAIPLPILKKRGRDIIPIYPGPEQFHALCEKTRALISRVEELEKTVKELSGKVFGEPLFEFLSEEWLASHKSLFGENILTGD